MLQCYALSAMIQKLGHTPFMIEVSLPIERGWKYKARSFISLRNFSSFRNNYLPKYVSKNFSFDEVVIGSDQVWNPALTGDCAMDFFGKFLNADVPVFSYAASFGGNTWLFPQYNNEVTSLLKKFQGISVREKSAVPLCKKEFGVVAKCVLDPTFLLQDYSALLKEKSNGKPYIVAFKLKDPLDYRWHSLLDSIKKKTGYEVVNIGLNTNSRFFKSISVENWLTSIYHAKAVITDSFHCMAMSIIFRKQVVVVSSVLGRECRMTDLLSDLSLSQLFMGTHTQVTADEVIDVWKKDINYELVNERLSVLRKDSIHFLKEKLQ